MRDPNQNIWAGSLQPQLANIPAIIPPSYSSLNLDPNLDPTLDPAFDFIPEPLTPSPSSRDIGFDDPAGIPDYLLDPNSAERSAFTLPEPKKQAAIHRFKTWPSKWLAEGRAPFINPSLYTSMPQALQDAYAACAIYATKTDANAPIAFSIIEAKANELMRNNSGSEIEGDGKRRTPLDLLSSIQALLIYQFMRLFDGDVRQRALAEPHLSILESWTADLQSQTVREQAWTVSSAPSWRSWIFAESCRRTIIMSIFLLGIYSLVRTGMCNRGAQMSVLSFTANRRLWHAASPAEFDRLREGREEEQLWIERMEFDSLFRNAKPADLEDFGVIMAIMYRGEDVVGHWTERKMAEELVPLGMKDFDSGAEFAEDLGFGMGKGVERPDMGRSLFELLGGNAAVDDTASHFGPPPV